MFPSITMQLVKSISYFDVCVGFGLSRTVFFIHVLNKVDMRDAFYTRDVTNEKASTTTSIMLGRRYVIGIERVSVRKEHTGANGKVNHAK